MPEATISYNTGNSGQFNLCYKWMAKGLQKESHYLKMYEVVNAGNKPM